METIRRIYRKRLIKKSKEQADTRSCLASNSEDTHHKIEAMLPEPKGCTPTIINIPYYSCSSDPNNLFGLAFDTKHKYRQREDEVELQHRKVSWHQTIMRRRGCVAVHEISSPVQKCFIEVL